MNRVIDTTGTEALMWDPQEIARRNHRTWCAAHGLDEPHPLSLTRVGEDVVINVVLPWEAYVVTRLAYGDQAGWLESWYRHYRERYHTLTLLLRPGEGEEPYAHHVIKHRGDNNYGYLVDLSYERAP